MFENSDEVQIFVQPQVEKGGDNSMKIQNNQSESREDAAKSGRDESKVMMNVSLFRESAQDSSQ